MNQNAIQKYPAMDVLAGRSLTEVVGRVYLSAPFVSAEKIRYLNLELTNIVRALPVYVEESLMRESVSLIEGEVYRCQLLNTGYGDVDYHAGLNHFFILH